MIELRGLYGIVDSPAVAGRLIDGGARVIQLRMKDASAAQMWKASEELLGVCRARGVAFVVNDRLDVALAVGADGVHLGQDDLPLAAARAIAAQASGFVIGISTHNEAQARAAIAGGADYIGFGPCFATQTKVNPDPVVGMEALARVCRLGVPVVAIGGITMETVGEVAQAGAAAAAVIRAVNGAEDVVAAARAVVAAFAVNAR